MATFRNVIPVELREVQAFHEDINKLKMFNLKVALAFYQGSRQLKKQL